MANNTQSRVTARDLITAAVAAGVVTGLLYFIATIWLTTPVILDAEVIELGDASLVDRGIGRSFWTLIGGVAFATSLSLILTPLIRSLGPAYRRNAAIVAGVSLAGWSVVTGVFFPLSPPGVEHLESVTVRQGGWILTALAFACVAGLALALYRIAAKRLVGRILPALLVVGLVCAVSGVIWLGHPGGLGHAAPTAVPTALIQRFELMGMLCNGVMFLGLAVSIPMALRRFTP